MEYVRYIIVSYLYIAILLLFRCLGIIIQLKMWTKIYPVESGYFLGKNWYFNEIR